MIIFFLAFLWFLSPFVSVYLFIVITPIFISQLKCRAYSLFSQLFLIAFISFMIVNRDVENGLYIGYGDDIYRYLFAFEQINNDYSFVSVYSKVLSITGSAEFLFWLFSYLVVNLTNDIYFTWFSIVFLSLLIIYFSLERLDYKVAGFVFSCFLLTITFHVYSGSIIRQLLAFSFVTLSLSFCSSIRTYKKGMVISFIPSFFHLSSIFLPIIIYGWDKFSKLRVKDFLFLLLLLLFLFIFFRFGVGDDSFIYQKFNARIGRGNELEGGWTWILQFIFELVAVLTFLKFAFPSIFKSHLFKVFVFFCLIVFFCIPFNYVSIRLYRYSYCFYMIFFVLYFRQTTNKLTLAYVLLTFFFYWGTLLLYKYWPSYGGSFLDSFFYNIQSIFKVSA
ncbi:EpsG family protein [Shewanella xiamenensis]|uniref:EpsG family protein n=1 Tax=Shewanella xiamenensis TaxID=332186 RepID=UPI00313BE52D